MLSNIKFESIIEKMETCEQSQGQSVYQHGISVKKHFDDLVNGNHSGFRIPSWFNEHNKEIISSLHDSETIEEYLIFHDCGKPFCKTIDENGKHHFYNHAEISKSTFLQYGGSQTVADLIGWDMVIHTAKAEEIDNYLTTWTPKDALTLLIAALAEVHSNAAMFGGTETISFKSKFKRIEQRGRQICKHFLTSLTAQQKETK